MPPVVMSSGEGKGPSFLLAWVLQPTSKVPSIPPCLVTPKEERGRSYLQMSSCSTPFSKLMGGEGTLTPPGWLSGSQLDHPRARGCHAC